MRREGNIIQEIIEHRNMSDSFDQVLRGTVRKQCREGKELLAHREEVIANLQREIADGTFTVTEYRERDIYEYGKHRRLQIVAMERRIGCNAIMNVVDKHLHARYIRTSGASIKKRGTHDMMLQVSRVLKDNPRIRYAYQYDIRHFYDNVVHKVAKDAFAHVFKDKILLKILGSLIDMLETGISFGLRISQATGNLILSIHLDHPLKDEMGVKHYFRYCDDGLVLAETKAELWLIRDAIHEMLEAVGFEIKPNERVFPVSEGIDFVGYKIYPDHVLLRKRIKKKFAAKIKKIKSRKRRHELIASFYGMTKHADCANLNNKLIGVETMKSFKDLKVTYQPANGQKFFPGDTISIRDLVNLEIIVHDFQLGVKTREGEDRCVVSIEMGGQMKKFITNSDEMKNVLSQIGEMQDGFPFETTIKAQSFGNGKTKYVFT
jgi:hypothetical protein